jgi:hypothetical protein
MPIVNQSVIAKQVRISQAKVSKALKGTNDISGEDQCGCIWTL